MDEQNRSDHATNVTKADGNVTAVNSIVERLQDILDGPVPMYVSRQDLRNAIKTIRELQATIAGWSQDISNLEDDNEQLNTRIINLQAHIQWLTQIAQERIHG